MFDMSLGEMMVIAVLILVFFQPDQLPELMRTAGRWYGKLKGASDDLRRAFNTEVARVEADKRREDLERRRAEIARRRVQADADAAPRPQALDPQPAAEIPPPLEPPASPVAPEGLPLPLRTGDPS